MVSVDRLTKVYGSRVAVWQVSFDVAPGEILGFLGPNGAGKTTTVRILTTILNPDAGRATILGRDVAKQAAEVTARNHTGKYRYDS